jgi:Protein of unknown function (DUF2652)
MSNTPGQPARAERLGPSRGTLILADISGYTAFFRAVQDAHFADMADASFVPEAYPLLSSLLDGIVERIAPPFTLSKLEGDAVFAFAHESSVPHGPALVDCLRACKSAFRSQLDAAVALMPCSCDACTNIGTLEIKFVVHHGPYVESSIAGREELLGPDVTVAHLLLKNHVAGLIGRSSYALITDAAAESLEVPLDGALPVTEEYEHYPVVRGYVLTLP